MKQSIILSTAIAAMALLIAGCDKDNESIVPAAFTASIDDMQTRAANTFWAKGDAIGISGKTTERTYANICYLTSGGDGTFTPLPGTEGSDNNIYFESSSPVDFIAYYPFTGTQGQPVTTIAKEITAADQTSDAQAAIDYLFGTGTGSQDSPTVKLTFAHRMSRVVLKFKAGDGFDQLPHLDCTLDGLLMSGTFNPAIGVAQASADASLKSITTHVSADVTGSGTSLILFPQATPTVAIDILADGVKYHSTLAFRLADGTMDEGLLPGVSYTFNVTIGKQGLTIEKATITDWDNSHSDNIDATM